MGNALLFIVKMLPSLDEAMVVFDYIIQVFIVQVFALRNLYSLTSVNIILLECRCICANFVNIHQIRLAITSYCILQFVANTCDL